MSKNGTSTARAVQYSSGFTPLLSVRSLKPFRSAVGLAVRLAVRLAVWPAVRLAVRPASIHFDTRHLSCRYSWTRRSRPPPASELGVSEQTLRRYITAGLIVYRQRPGGHYRIPRDRSEEH